MEILVLFDSKGGHTYELAKAVAQGIEQIEGVKARIRYPRETTPIEVIRSDQAWSEFYDFKIRELQEVTMDDMAETDGLAMGSPTRFGNMTPALGNFIESLGPLWSSGVLVGKPAGVFCSTSSMHGGNEMTLISMMIPLMHLGYIIVPAGYTIPSAGKTTRGGTPYGPTSVSGIGEASLTDDERAICLAFGKRLAEVAIKLKG
ncbi:MAG: NAD(P)H:quinone oxidoreductase [Armatimonadetes bacterium]|nr:NAD(P)H:quinone oxidoreductase [Armatimonadota bacterium]